MVSDNNPLMNVIEMPTNRSDAVAITASLEEPRRFGVVFDRHVDAIYGYLARRVGVQNAEELTAETFLCAFDARRRFSGGDALPWLYGIATNQIHRHRRDERRQLAAYTRAATDVMDFDEGDIEGRLDAAASAPLLSSALQQLDPGDRDALLLHTWQGLSYKEIAEALDIAIGTVGSRLNRARRLVRASLEQDERFREDIEHG